MKKMFINSNAKVLACLVWCEERVLTPVQTCWECVRINGFPLLSSTWRHNRHTLHHQSSVWISSWRSAAPLASAAASKAKTARTSRKSVLAFSISLSFLLTDPTSLTIRTSTTPISARGNRTANHNLVWPHTAETVVKPPSRSCWPSLPDLQELPASEKHTRTSAFPTPAFLVAWKKRLSVWETYLWWWNCRSISICGCIGWHKKTKKCTCLWNLLSLLDSWRWWHAVTGWLKTHEKGGVLGVKDVLATVPFRNSHSHTIKIRYVLLIHTIIHIFADMINMFHLLSFNTHSISHAKNSAECNSLFWMGDFIFKSSVQSRTAGLGSLVFLLPQQCLT